MLVPWTRSMFVYPYCLVFDVVQFKYRGKRFELFKIRRYIKYPLLFIIIIILSKRKFNIIIGMVWNTSLQGRSRQLKPTGNHKTGQNGKQ